MVYCSQPSDLTQRKLHPIDVEHYVLWELDILSMNICYIWTLLRLSKRQKSNVPDTPLLPWNTKFRKLTRLSFSPRYIHALSSFSINVCFDVVKTKDWAFVTHSSSVKSLAEQFFWFYSKAIPSTEVLNAHKCNSHLHAVPLLYHLCLTLQITFISVWLSDDCRLTSTVCPGKF